MAIRELTSPTGAFLLPLHYRIEVSVDPDALVRLDLNINSESLHRELLGLAWADYWEEFVYQVCHPDGAVYQRRDVLGASAFASNVRPNGSALAIHPADLAGVDPSKMNWSEPARPRYGIGARPSVGFVANLGPQPKRVSGEEFALGLGTQVGDDGRPEFGIVLSFELTDFEAEYGSLRAKGVLLLKGFGKKC